MDTSRPKAGRWCWTYIRRCVRLKKSTCSPHRNLAPKTVYVFGGWVGQSCQTLLYMIITNILPTQDILKQNHHHHDGIISCSLKYRENPYLLLHSYSATFHPHAHYVNSSLWSACRVLTSPPTRSSTCKIEVHFPSKAKLLGMKVDIMIISKGPPDWRRLNQSKPFSNSFRPSPRQCHFFFYWILIDPYLNKLVYLRVKFYLPFFFHL